MIKELRDAVVAARAEFLKLPQVIGAGPDRHPETGEYRIVVYIYPVPGPDTGPGPGAAKGAPVSVAPKEVPDRFRGFPVVVRQPRWELPDDEDGEEDPCHPGRHRHADNSDFRFLDWGKVHAIHRDELRRIVRPAGPPRVRIDGEILTIEDDGTLVTGTGALDYVRAWQIFRGYFGDDYDFVSFYIDRSSTDADGNRLPGPGGAVGITIFNNTTGLNHWRGDSYNDRPAWGSSKLLAYQAYSGSNWSLGVQLQEVGHHWGAFVYHRDPVTNLAERDQLHRDFFVPGQEIFHWGTWFDNDNSSMDYDSQDWVPAGPGRWSRAAVTAATAGYHNLDLYLMGLLSQSEVGAITYINNPTLNPVSGLYEGAAVNLGIHNITAHHGSRNPAYPGTQRVFHLAHVVLTKDLDTAGDLTTGFIAQIEQNREALTDRFRRATYGRAMLDTSLLRSHYTGLYVRDNAADTGGSGSTGAFWNSPDLWVRNADDGGTSHQDTVRGHDNYIRVRLHNSSGTAYENVTVRVYLANFAGTEFRYPDDWNPLGLVGEATLDSVPAGSSAVAQVTWAAGAIPPAAADLHPCLLAEAIPMETAPSGRHYVWQNRKLCQKNITIVNAPAAGPDRPRALVTVWPVTVGHPAAGARTATLTLHQALLPADLAQPAADGLLPREASGRLMAHVKAEPLPAGVKVYIDPKGALPEAFEAAAARAHGQTTLLIPRGTQIGVACGPCADRPEYQLTFCDGARVSVGCVPGPGTGGLRGLEPVIVGGRRLLAVTDARTAAMDLPLAAGERREVAVEVHLEAGHPTGRALLLSLSQSEADGSVTGGVDLLVNT